MILFCLPSVFATKALIEQHFWKFEFRIETYDMYSTFYDNVHVIMAMSLTDNVVCVYSSVSKYKMKIYTEMSITPIYCLGNDIFSFRATILDTNNRNRDSRFEDKDEIVYEAYDSLNTLCVPRRKLFFNSVIIGKYDWSVLQTDLDYILLNLEPNTYKDPVYIIESNLYKQLLCERNSTPKCCKHMGKRIRNISGGYKEVLFDVVTQHVVTCPCSFFDYLNKRHSSTSFNFVLLSYKLTQFFLNF